MRAAFLRVAVVSATEEGFGTGGFAGFINDNIIQIILLVIAAIALWAGKNGNVSKVATIGVCAVMGLMILALSVNNGALGKELGEWAIGLFRTGGGGE
jgi:hypothetical protein